jgi:uncharacterized protein
LFNDFWIWDAEKNNWILFLIALEEREIRLEVWIWLDTYITDNIAWNILDDYVVPYLKGNKRDEWIKNWYNAVYAKLITYYWLDSDVEGKKPFLSNIKERLKSLWGNLLFIILFPILFIVSLIFWKWNSSWRGWGGGWFKWGGWSSRWWWASRRF